MVKRCILHIGMHKTGSSSIQDSLHGNLKNEQFHYAELDRPNHSGAVMYAFAPLFQSPVDVARGWTVSVERKQAARQMLERAFAECPSETLIISAEAMCAGQMDVRALQQFVQARSDEVKVVGYVRPPRASTESRFQQHVKVHLPMEPARSWPGYRKQLARFDALFGRENVEFWRFDPATFPGGCVVADFCQRLGIALDPAWVKRSNEGLSRPAIALLYCYRHSLQGVATAPWMMQGGFELVSRLRSLQGEKLRFSDAFFAPVLREIEEDVRWMEDRLGASLDEAPLGPGKGLDSPAQLLEIDGPARAWLMEQTGEHLPERAAPEQVARLVDGLVRRLSKLPVSPDVCA